MRTSAICGGTLLALVLTTNAAEHHLALSEFTSAEQCGACHVEIYQQWRLSAHGRAATDPIFWQMLPQAAREMGGETSAGFCLTCHSPIGSVTKEIPLTTPLSFPLKLAPIAEEGVTCDFCHTISGEENLGKHISVGIYRYPRKGDTAIKYGAHANARTTNHITQVSKFLTSAEFCGICHKFAHPASGQVWQDTYAEWKAGPYAKLGLRCQDCHMPTFIGHSATEGPERVDLHAHVFPGGDSELVKKVAAVTLLAQRKEKAGKPSVDVKALVTNVGSGHLMPTGLPGIREMWLEVVAQDAQAKEVFREKFPIGIELLGGDGKPTMPWNAVRFGKDTRVGPRKTRQMVSSFPLPETAGGPLEIRGSVYYRLISEMAARVAKIQPSNPLEIATDRVRIFPNGRVERVKAY